VAVSVVVVVTQVALSGSGGRFPGVVAPFAAVLDLELYGDVPDPHQ
jgi:hypothetical protein